MLTCCCAGAIRSSLTLPAFDPAQAERSQRRQFGYNNDFDRLHPARRLEPSTACSCVNHEYTNAQLMFPGARSAVAEGKIGTAPLTQELVDIEMAAHGGTVVEIRKADGKWQVVPDSPYNRRITATTEMTITGPAAGHDRLKTSADPTGSKGHRHAQQLRRRRDAVGHLADAPRRTSTATSAGELPAEAPGGAPAYKRYGVPGRRLRVGELLRPLRLAKEPNEPNRFGWIVEIDPIDPTSVPKKRTALGRFKHEGARVDRRRRTAASSSTSATTSASTTSTSSSPPAAFDPERPRRQHGPARRRHALRREVRRGRHAGRGCRWSMARGR